MIINQNGLGDSSLLDSMTSGDTSSWLFPVIGIGALILLFGLSKPKKQRVTYKVSRGKSNARTSKAISKSPSSLSSTQKDVIDALVGQGASKSEARKAVEKAGNGSFDDIFRKVSKSLI